MNKDDIIAFIEHNLSYTSKFLCGNVLVYYTQGYYIHVKADDILIHNGGIFNGKYPKDTDNFINLLLSLGIRHGKSHI